MIRRRGLKVAGMVVLALLIVAMPVVGRADAGESEAAIRKVLEDQTAAWNRGDVAGFMQGYKDADDTTFVSTVVTKGYQAVLARYKERYPTTEKMGKLDFSELDVRLLGKDHAIVTGKYHLARTPEAGGEAEGIFSLVFEDTKKGWKIIVDHTAPTKPAP